MASPTLQALLDELDRLHTEHGRTPTRALMAGQGAFDPDQYLEEFESWDEALLLAGFDPDDLDRERYATVEQLDQPHQAMIQQCLDSNETEPFFRGQLLAEVWRLAVELGRTPSTTEMNQYGRYADSTYWDYFDSWTGTLEELDLEPNTDSERIPDSALLAELRRLAEELGGRPRVSDVQEHGEYAVPTYYAHFDGWDDACGQAGL